MLIKIHRVFGKWGRVVEETTWATCMVALFAIEEELLAFFLYFLSFLRKYT